MSIIIKDLVAGIEDNQILKGLNLEIPKGEVHAIMGPNGSGKSTLSKVIAGHEDYEVESGSIDMDGKDVLEMDIDERSREGIFLAFQYPMEIPGVSNANFIRAALQARLPEGEELDAVAYYKRNEILQMMMLDPSYCILDETDSGLDIDALKIVSNGVNMLRSPDRGFLVITHYQRLLNYIKPDVVHVLHDGKIIKTGGPELALELEERGYDHIIKPEAVEA